ncbi:MAG: 3-oxoacyl-[acyl-carrier-protein] synthase [Frankiaceae bacterium]|nr:3-oxoacyl-[acyl-carrier-protein] synthase [Frankiaceae bacterium]
MTYGTRISGLGDYRPSTIISNEDMAKLVETSDEWIRTRVGIANRRKAGADETVVTMATAAGAKAIADAGIDPTEIDLVLVATCSLLATMPHAAPRVAVALGIPSPGAVDINAACAGFCYALSFAADAVRGGTARNVLVIGAEKLTDITNWEDRNTCILFGDGAGAALVSRSADGSDGIGPVVMGSAGELSEFITMNDKLQMVMEGQSVYRWATGVLPSVVREILDRTGIDAANLDALVLHQANLRIIDSVARSLHLPESVAIGRDIVESGNTSAASIPLALTTLRETGEVTSGDRMLLLGFGGGLSYAGQVITCP